MSNAADIDFNVKMKALVKSATLGRLRLHGGSDLRGSFSIIVIISCDILLHSSFRICVGRPQHDHLTT